MPFSVLLWDAVAQAFVFCVVLCRRKLGVKLGCPGMLSSTFTTSDTRHITQIKFSNNLYGLTLVAIEFPSNYPFWLALFPTISKNSNVHPFIIIMNITNIWSTMPMGFANEYSRMQSKPETKWRAYRQPYTWYSQ